MRVYIVVGVWGKTSRMLEGESRDIFNGKLMCIIQTGTQSFYNQSKMETIKSQ